MLALDAEVCLVWVWSARGELACDQQCPGVPTTHDSDLHSAASAVPLVWLLRPACSPPWALL